MFPVDGTSAAAAVAGSSVGAAVEGVSAGATVGATVALAVVAVAAGCVVVEGCAVASDDVCELHPVSESKVPAVAALKPAAINIRIKSRLDR